LAASALCDANRFAWNLQAVYRGMWQAYLGDVRAVRFNPT
jgi:hypothetical protein